MRILGREIALWLAFFSGCLQLASAFWLDLSTEQQAWINAALVAAAGVVTAFMVHRDQILPAVTGLLQSLMALAAGFGFDLSPDQQSSLMAFTTIVVTFFFVRQNVVAPVDELGQRRERSQNPPLQQAA